MRPTSGERFRVWRIKLRVGVMWEKLSKIPSRNYHCLPWKELCRTGSNATSKYIIKSEGNFLCICYSLTKCIYELRFYRLKAKKKMISPNLEVRIRYKLEKVGYHCDYNFYILASNNGMDIVLSFILTYNSKGQAKGNLELRKFDVAKSPPETIIVYHGKNYVEPEVMPPPNTLSKVKALEKYRYEQSLEHTSQFIERLEKGLEEYHQHLAKFKNGKNDIAKDVNLAGMLLLKKVKLLIWYGLDQEPGHFPGQHWHCP
eukprot:XP_025984911.1 uncharacterized protein LOC113002163 [Glycine max]